MPTSRAPPSRPGAAAAWLLATRPKTLPLAAAPVVVGTAWAYGETACYRPDVLVAALVVSLAIQVGTNLHNDAADGRRGADRPGERLGPPRATASGWLSARAVMVGAVAAFAVALAAGLYLATVGGWPVLLVGAASLAAAVGYSAGPLPISRTAFGEVFAWLFFGVVAVAGTAWLHTAALAPGALLAGAVVGLPAAAVLVVNNTRDRASDAANGRRTFAVLFGPAASRWQYGLCLLVPVAAAPWLGPGAGWPGALAVAFAVPLVRRFRRMEPGPGMNDVLAATARFQLLYCLLLAAGWIFHGWSNPALVDVQVHNACRAAIF